MSDPTAGPRDQPAARAAVVIPAKDEQARIASTVAAARRLPGVDLVVVVDDGSTDATSRAAEQAGAHVVRHDRNRGKGTAMESGARTVRLLEAEAAADAVPHALLFLDADLEETASRAAPLLGPVLDGAADMSVAVLPPQRSKGGGHGFVVRLAREGIRAATGWSPQQPLSGQRCLSRSAFERVLPLAPGFGVEVGLTVDLLRAGGRAREVECELHHRVTGTDLRAQLHRARQLRDVARALAVRGVLPQALPALVRARR